MDFVLDNEVEVLNVPKMVKIFFLRRGILECQELPYGPFHPQEPLFGMQKYLQECILVGRNAESLYLASEAMKPLAS